MKHRFAWSFIKAISPIIAAVFLCLTFSAAYAQAGCCSRHGGVAGCNNATGYQLCKDGSTSASCACSGMTPKAVTPVKATKTTKTTTKTTTPKPKAVKTTTTVATPAPVATPAATNPKGCCSRHGGVAQCNKKSGYLMCKDGSQSSNCSCS